MDYKEKFKELLYKSGAGSMRKYSKQGITIRGTFYAYLDISYKVLAPSYALHLDLLDYSKFDGDASYKCITHLSCLESGHVLWEGELLVPLIFNE